MIQDIRIDVRWRSHPKRAKLAFLLGHDGTGYVLDLWISTAQSKPDGVLRGLDDMDIALMAGWRGRPEDFVSALHATRLLDRLPDGSWALHDWAEHQPWVIGEPARVAKARKAANARHHGPEKRAETDQERPGNAVLDPLKMPEVGPKNTESMLGACSKHASSTAQAMLKHKSSNAPLQCLSSFKGRKTPPVRDKSLTSPTGGGKGYSEAFLAWWKVYPLKVKQPRAWDQWKLTKGVDAKTLIDAVLSQAKAGHHTYHDGDMWPHPNKWLKDKRWNDEIKGTEAGGALAWAAQDEGGQQQ